MNKQIESAQNLATEMSLNEIDIIRRKSFLEFAQSDAEHLKALYATSGEFLPHFIENFYEHILDFKELSSLIPDDEAMTKLKRSQLDYFQRLCRGQYDWNYVLNRLQVGMAHERVGMGLQWYIGGFRKYLSELLHHICDDEQNDKKDVAKLFDAVLKIISFDMGLAIETYMHVRENKIADLEHRLDGLIRGIRGIIWEFDVAGNRFSYVSRQTESLLGYPPTRWLQDADFWYHIIHQNDRDKVKNALHQAIENGISYDLEYRIIAENESVVWINERVTTIDDSTGRVKLVRGLMLDVRERKHFEKQLAHLATHDDLTGLANRNLFESRLKHAINRAQRTGLNLAILCLDLDGFKDINDSLGHETGDHLLQATADRISTILRNEDLAARFGGDEFCILLEDITDTYLPADVASRCLKALNQTIHCEGSEIYPQACIGIAMFPKDGATAQMLMRAADSAMYVAKHSGKHRYEFYQQKMTVLARNRLTLENDLQRAVEQNEFELYYQPQISTATGRLQGVEALIRWNHPQLGIVPPDKFIPVAERTGLIISLGAWVITAACKQMAEWRKQSIYVGKIAINLSGTQLSDQTLLDLLVEVLAETGIQASDLVIEVTEGTVQVTKQGLQTFQRLKSIGIKIAIDDFGTGYSCLSSLTQLPIDCVKIDKSFVQNIQHKVDDSAIIATIVSMSRVLGLLVVAEGVETIDHVHYLNSIGCDLLQGYYFSRPVPAHQISTFVAFNYSQKLSQDKPMEKGQ